MNKNRFWLFGIVFLLTFTMLKSLGAGIFFYFNDKKDDLEITCRYDSKGILDKIEFTGFLYNEPFLVEYENAECIIETITLYPQNKHLEYDTLVDSELCNVSFFTKDVNNDGTLDEIKVLDMWGNPYIKNPAWGSNKEYTYEEIQEHYSKLLPRFNQRLSAGKKNWSFNDYCKLIPLRGKPNEQKLLYKRIRENK